ncbi:MAG: hypothetical protein CMI31_15610 [Opitutae bacterium]|nr:hypothetical protein [Opitutae bacterium]
MSYNRTISFTEQPKGFTVDYLGPEPVPAAEVENRERAARELGKREALDEARQELQRMRVEFGDRHDQVLATLQNQFSEMTQELIKRLPELTIALTERILGEISLDREMIVGVVTNLIGEFATEDEKLEVFLSPEDLNLLKAGDKLSKEEPEEVSDTDDFSGALAGLFDGIGGADALLEGYPNVVFHEDTELGRGDCQIKSRFGLVDGRILTKLNKVAEELDQ